MSLSVEPDQQDLLKISAKKLGISVSQLVRDLVDKHLTLLCPEDSEIPVIIRIPANLKGDPEGLKQWLDTKTGAIVKSLAP
mgnify:CR=1 FL=1